MKAMVRAALLVVAVAFALRAEAASPGQEALDRGAALFKAGKYEEAIGAFKEATQLDPGLLRAWENLGWAYHRSGHHTEALETWDRVLKVEPKRVSLLNEIAAVQLGLGHWSEAATFLKRSLAADPSQSRVRPRLAEALEKAGDTKAAEAYYREAATRAPKELAPTLRLQEFLERSGNTDEALRVLRQSESRLQPYDHLLQLRIARLEAGRGDEAYRRGDYPTALAAYERSVVAQPQNAQYRINRGWARRQLGDASAAAEDWRVALELDPGRSALYRHIADVALEQEDLATAAEMYSRAWDEDQRQPSVPYRLASIALEDGRDEDALHWLAELFLVPDADATWSKRVAGVFGGADRAEQGIAFFEARMPQSGEPTETKRALAQLHAYAGSSASKAGDLARARQELETAVSLDPASAPALRDLGWVYWALHDWDACETTWRRFAAAHPDDVQAQGLLSRVALERKNYDTAITAARASLALQPDQPLQQLRLAKALFWAGHYQEGRDLAEKVARENPDELAAQVLWGELLMQYHDFARGKDQWRRVLDMGNRTPRAELYWVQSQYELGEYDAALAAARHLIETEGPKQPLLQFLADDATREGRFDEAIQWYAMLAENFPERLPAWLELARLQMEKGEFEASRSTLQKAAARFPEEVAIPLALADLDRHAGRAEAAREAYTQIAREHPTTREAFWGRVRAAAETGHDAEALATLRTGGPRFLKPYEVRMQEASVLVAMHDDDAAQRALSAVIESPGGYVPILLYHGLGDHVRSASLPVHLFESQMAALHDQGYTTLTVQDLARIAAGQAELPERPILVTFDDARIDSFERADPILARYGMKATMFVPTGRIKEGHPFFADWTRMSALMATGRWDLESHGHFAHDPIVLGSKEEQGSFLVNRQWLEDEGRLETHEEYVARLTGDYQRSIREIETRFPGTHVVGYAFPFSESGQESVGNEPASAETNQALLERLFRFGFVQDQSGYNEIRPGETLVLLRRFGVPRDFDGDALLRHLALNQPRAEALAQSARIHYWSGEYDRARTLFTSLAADEPRMQAEASYYLASIQYERGRYDAALHHLQVAESLGATRLAADPGLARRIRFEGVRLVPKGEFTSDSDQRETQREGLEVRTGTLGPVEASFGMDHMVLRQEGFASLDGRELAAAARLGPFSHWSLDGRVWQRAFDGVDDTLSYNAGLGFESDRLLLRVSGGRQDVDTLLARTEALQAEGVVGHGLFRLTRSVVATFDGAFDRRDDGNERTDYTGRLTLRPAWGRAVGLGFGAAAGWSDTLFQSPLYYSPESLRWARGTLSFGRHWGAGWSVEGDLGAGVASDELHGDKGTFLVTARAGQPLGRNLGTILEGRYSSSPGYSGWGVGAALEIRVW